MKALQKNLLAIAAAVILLDLFLQLSDLSLFTLSLMEGASSTISQWSFPIAFIFGSLLAGLLCKRSTKVYWISLSFYLLSLCFGGYILTKSLKTYMYLNIFHGVLASYSLVMILNLMLNLTNKEHIRRDICGLGLFITIPFIILLALRNQLASLLGTHWGILGMIFAYSFTGTLIILLTGYLNIDNKKTEPVSLNKMYYGIYPMISSYPLLGLLIGIFTLGFIYRRVFQNPSYGGMSSITLINILVFSTSVILITKIGALADIIGDIKGILIGLLLLAFSLSLFPLVEGVPLLIIPMILCGAAYGILIPSISGYFWNLLMESHSAMLIGIYLIFTYLAGLLGFWAANAVNNEFYSPYLFNCLIIISICIPYIRRIHQEASSY